jgi:hypothetical protein
MSDQLARSNLLIILMDPVLYRINFSVGGVGINPAMFVRVLMGVVAGHITVRHVPRLVSPGIYNSTENRFYLRRDSFPTIPAQALAVHEACHAGCDVQRASQMRTAESETAAYIAQCVYARSKCADPSSEPLYDDDPRRDRVFELAWGVAGTILAGRAPSASELGAVRMAVLSHPNYASTAQDLAGFDGVPGL